MIELESDKRKKLCLVAFLYLNVLAFVGYLYYSNANLDLESALLMLIKTP